MSEPAELSRYALRDFPLPRVCDGDKNEHGKLLLVAGCRQIPGSAILSATAALRSGAGKVQIGTVETIAPALALHMPEVLVIPLAEARDGGFAKAAAKKAGEAAEMVDSIVAGPGLLEGGANGAIAAALLEPGKPVAFDAGILHCLPAVADRCRAARIPPILLPHSGEMASLLGIEPEEVERDRLAAARKAAEHFGAFVLSKGAQSQIAAPDGRSWIFLGGVPGLGIAGSGDTLAGIVGALLARGADPLTALLWSVLLHGEAGESLSRKVGPVGFLAREIPDELPALLAG